MRAGRVIIGRSVDRRLTSVRPGQAGIGPAAIPLFLVPLVIVTVVACGTEPAVRSGEPDGESWAGLSSCGETGSPVAAFEGSDEGVGYPDDTEGAPPGADVWFLDADGDVTRVTDDHLSLDPVLSRDGATLYFTRADEDTASIGQPGVELWARDVASEEETLLASAEEAFAGLGELAESPDGTRLAFAMETVVGGLSQRRLFSLSTDGGDPEVVPWLAAGEPNERQRQPAWSPDGSVIAYVHEEYVDAEDWSSIRELDPRTGEERVILEAQPVRLFNLAWLPDGSGLLATKTLTGGMLPSTVVTVDAETGAETAVAEGAGVAAELASMDATMVAELGYAVESLEEPARGPVLRIWTHGEHVDHVLPGRFAYATDLSIAECAYVE